VCLWGEECKLGGFRLQTIENIMNERSYKSKNVPKSLNSIQSIVLELNPNQPSIDELSAKRKQKLHQPLILRTPQYTKGLSSNVMSAGEEPSENIALDGFALLEATGMNFPDDGRQVKLNGKNFNSVVEPDLAYFTGLLFLDLSDNFLDIECFATLPRLKELRLAYNRISNISDLSFGFPRLQYLDLSYNSLTVNSVEALAAIPNLKELDLCGNNLGGLPRNMSSFLKLEKIALEQNKIDENGIFITLSRLPTIRVICLAYNFLTRIPAEACSDDHCFR